MAAVKRSKVVPVRSQRSTSSARRRPPQPRPTRRSSVDLLNSPSPQFPHWLILLMAGRKITTPILVGLILGILPLYAWRVNTQQAWGNQYIKLEKLQRDQRAWTTRHEERKYQISETLERNPAGFMPKSSKTTVFIKPAPARPPRAVPPHQTGMRQINAAPIGY